MRRDQTNQREQKALKTMDKVYQLISKAMLYLAYLCIPVFFILTVYYGVRRRQGIDVGNRLSLAAAGFAVFSVVCGIVKLLEFILRKVHQKEYDFDPLAMELPERGAVTLETALHMMAVKTGVIAWDTVFITLLACLLALLIFVGGNVPLILLICLILAILLVSGHAFFSWRWKKRPFTDRMLRNSQKYISIKAPQRYALTVENSLLRNILYYAKEVVLTDDFIIGLTGTDLEFQPVAIPRSEIAELVFFDKRLVTNTYRKYDMGILMCRMYSGKSVELLIGQGPRALRMLKVLNHYRIRWKEADTVYE